MQTHDLIQGSPEWQAFRLKHFGASEAAAMLGLSKNVKRSELLRMKHSGDAKEFSDWVQTNILDHGHEVEALARPIVERILGEDLYPVTCSQGILSASCDGLTMMEDIAFEHKQWNSALAEAVQAGLVPEEHMPQCQQIMLVTGCSKVLFVVSDGTEQNMECVHVLPDQNWFSRIKAGWEQFAIDLAAYVPAEVVAEAVGRTPETLPALRIELTGEVTSSNLSIYKEHAFAVFKAINKNLQTDQHFADAEKTVKWCGDIEDRLASAKQHALSQTNSIDALFRAIDDISAEARATRLELEKLVKARKETIRNEIYQEGMQCLLAHVSALNDRLGKPYMPVVSAEFAGAMKGKKTVTSLRDAMGTALANVKIEANAIADKIQINLTTLREMAANYAFLFADTGSIVLKQNDDLTALVKLRIAEHEAAEASRLVAQREQIRIEEEAKAAAKVKAEQEAVAKLEAEKLNAEALEATRAAISQAAAPVPAPVTVITPVPTPDSTATIRLGEISNRLGFGLTEAFISQLGFHAIGKERAAVLYRADDFRNICRALINHISDACQAQAA